MSDCLIMNLNKGSKTCPVLSEFSSIGQGITQEDLGMFSMNTGLVMLYAAQLISQTNIGVKLAANSSLTNGSLLANTSAFAAANGSFNKSSSYANSNTQILRASDSSTDSSEGSTKPPGSETDDKWKEARFKKIADKDKPVSLKEQMKKDASENSDKTDEKIAKKKDKKKSKKKKKKKAKEAIEEKQAEKEEEKGSEVEEVVSEKKKKKKDKKRKAEEPLLKEESKKIKKSKKDKNKKKKKDKEEAVEEPPAFVDEQQLKEEIKTQGE